MEKITEKTDEQIKKMYIRVTWDIFQELANYLDSICFPNGKRISFKGNSHSKVEKKELWLEYDDDNEPQLCSNLVPNKPRNMYNVDLINPEFAIEVRNSIISAANNWLKYMEVEKWIDAGNRCVYRSGWAYRGAGCREINKEQAKELLPKYSFGKGFYELSWITIDNERVLEFNELSENDMW